MRPKLCYSHCRRSRGRRGLQDWCVRAIAGEQWGCVAWVMEEQRGRWRIPWSLVPSCRLARLPGDDSRPGGWPAPKLPNTSLCLTLQSSSLRDAARQDQTPGFQIPAPSSSAGVAKSVVRYSRRTKPQSMPSPTHTACFGFGDARPNSFQRNSG